MHFNFIPTIYEYEYESCVPFSRWMEELKRFRKRIDETELILQPILTPHHRAEIWKKRVLSEE